MGFLNNIGTTELIVIAIVLLLFFGGKKLTELARGLGQSSKELKKVRQEFEQAVKEEKDLTETDKEETKGGAQS